MRYVPAVLITLYDGYYIYSPAEYSYTSKEYTEGKWKEVQKKGYTHVLKPYVYYSARYEDSSGYVVVNYSLDNYIAIYGVVGGETVSKSGYLETNDFLNSINVNPETLTENIRYKDSSGNIQRVDDCQFFYKDGKKIYNIGGKPCYLNDQTLVVAKDKNR